MSELHGYKRDHIFRDLYSSLVRSLCKIKIIYIYKDSRGFKLYTGCPKKNYTLFDFMYRKPCYSYFTKIKSIVFTKD
jgi:hypothetical protein